MGALDWEVLADVARSMSDGIDLHSTADLAVQSAPRIIAGCTDAGVSLVDAKGRVTTEASTSARVERADHLQHELAEGPCVQAITDSETVLSTDLTHECRWPGWAPRVVDELGFRSVLAVQPFATAETFGAMTLYSDRPDAFNDDAVQAALALAAHVAVASKAADTVAHLESALEHRDVIGQAKGRLVDRFGLTPDQAFGVLVRLSQDENVKLHVIADRVSRLGWESAPPR